MRTQNFMLKEIIASIDVNFTLQIPDVSDV